MQGGANDYTIAIHYSYTLCGVSSLGNEHKTAFHSHETLYKQTLFPHTGLGKKGRVCEIRLKAALTSQKLINK